ncbi:FecCD family ABC transporter permease [Mangrovicoccus algicola]|uniref:Iron chelate uptake ABC transporter family permease subunit n=1 Tax=Mangrovicoccus algicola TaxID=2771008 RepID=A0A8J7CZW7_9RHOB|nr:iron chelate uptake ABC transporter family permease subunit [Mangrovicoccus algicola]MBE3638563.1 iron chelate uptake ABC transporter family permease subunit [Mangrovicoccus algicola]
MSGAGIRVLRLGPVSLLLRPRVVAVSAVLLVMAAALGLVLLATGTLRFDLSEVMAGLMGGSGDPRLDRVIRGIRLPRVLTAALVGAALGLSGAVFQSITRNPLGSPDVIGFTTGAATGAIVQIILFDAGAAGTAAAAAGLGMLTALCVFLLARRGQSSGGDRLVLVGIGVGAVLSGLNTLLLVMGDLDQAMAAQVWLAGSLAARSWAHVGPAALGLVLLAPVALIHARRLDMMEMGDDMARQVGVEVERVRLVMVVAAVGLTSVATAAAGPVTFVALAAPHLSRRLTGAPGPVLLPAALMGAVLVLAADLGSLQLRGTVSVPIGVMTGLLGGLYLLWLVAGRRR